MYIDIRITLGDEAIGVAKSVAVGVKGRELTDNDVEVGLIHSIVSDVNNVESAVVLRNDGFGHMLPDESTRQER